MCTSNSTYMAGVFLAVLTYRGPQLIYHYYDQNLASDSTENNALSDVTIDWSEEEDSAGEEPPATSVPSSPVLSTTSASNGSLSRHQTPLNSRSVNSATTASPVPVTIPNKYTSPVSNRMSSSQPTQTNRISGSSAGASTPLPVQIETVVEDVEHPTTSSPATTAPQVTEDKAMLPCNFEQEDIAEILCPPESLCNQKFSLTVEDSVFVGLPVHILESGTWRTVKDEYNDVSESESPESTEFHKSRSPVDDTTEPKMKAKKLKGVVTEEDSPMRMFHICFVCSPTINEAIKCEELLYEYALIPFVRTLRQEQASKNYVWQEVAKMQRVAEMTTNLSPFEKQEALEANSELARALREMVTAISNMNIARVLIANKPRTFQVPLQLELTQIPGWFDKALPHSYLSTSNISTKEIGHDCYECYGLLLLDDPEIIVKEIDVDPQGAVAVMIRNIDPMSSIEEMAQKNGIELKQIVNLVWSLVYWRRARLIIPLNYKHTYCVSPVAPKEEISSLSKKFHLLFPVMPQLQRFLSLLSTSKPKPFSFHVPSMDHRSIYLQSLAWLLQNDLIVHLATFAQVYVTRKIKLACMDAETGALEETSMQLGDNDTVDETLAGQLRRRKWMRRQSSSYRGDFHDIQESVIADPRSASSLEKKWLAQIALSGVSRSADLAGLFQRLTKYFNRQDCLEQVMVREKLTREEMKKLLQEFSPYIITYRHW